MTERHAQKRLDDAHAKLDSARKAAERADAGEREKADLKLHEQEAIGQKLRARHPRKPAAATRSEPDRKLDQALEDSFPASDPVSLVQPMRDGGADNVPADGTRSRQRPDEGRPDKGRPNQ